MKKIAVLFAGQGSQYHGMGKDFYEQFNESKKIYDQASEILGTDIKKLCFTENDLINETKYTQPAILVTSLAIYEVVKTLIPEPNSMAGFSLGEYSALAGSGVFDYPTIFQLIKYRAQFMQEAAEKTNGGMAAILSLEREVLEDLCERIGNVSIANYNCPGQLVVSGEYDSVIELCNLAKEKGARRAVVLNVSGGFHTSLMKEAAEKMYEKVKDIKYQAPKIPLYMNCNAKQLDIRELPKLMKQQIESSIYFEDTIRNMIEDGIDIFIEIGPGSVLSGFVRKIDRDKKIITINSIKDLELLKEEDLWI